MRVQCPACKAQYLYDEARFGQAVSKKLKCSRCGEIFTVYRPPADPTHGASASSNEVQETHTRFRSKEETTREIDLAKLAGDADLPQLAPLPRNRRYSLAVILGADAGKIFAIDKPRVILGRAQECDVRLGDSEVSRRHAMLEIRQDEATLTDLGSTNGTFVEGVRVEKATLTSHQEFSLGTTTLMFIVTEVRETETP